MGEKMCVTGAGGFLASWLVKDLLSKGYSVHGTVRDPSDEKHDHLNKLKNANVNLKLFKAELLEYESLHAAMVGCTGVFHVACPVAKEVDLLEPAIKGTLNVMKACHEAKVKRVVVVSSAAAVVTHRSWYKGQIRDEASWTDIDYCKEIENWYNLGKTKAEMQAIEYAKRHNMDLITFCPTLLLGPVLQSWCNPSSMVPIQYMREGYKSMANLLKIIVDVRDASEALIMLYENPEAKGRYICNAHEIKIRDLVNMLKAIYPNFNYPKSYVEVNYDERVSSEKLLKMGWTFRPLLETLTDSVDSYIKKGFFRHN